MSLWTAPKLHSIKNKELWFFVSYLVWFSFTIILSVYFLVMYLLPLLGMIQQPMITVKWSLEIVLCTISLVAGSVSVIHRVKQERINLELLGDTLTLSVGNRVVSTSCLEIVSAPASVDCDTEGNIHYNTSLLIALRSGMSKDVSIAFEAGVHNDEPFIRLFITTRGKSIRQNKHVLKMEATRIEAVLLSTLNNIELEQLSGVALKEAVSAIVNPKLLKKSEELISDVPERALFCLSGHPQVKITKDSSQIGAFLSSSLKQGQSVTFTCVLSATNPGREKRKLESKWRSIRGREQRKEDSLEDQIAKRELVDKYSEIKGDSGWFDCSAYVIISAKCADELESAKKGVYGKILSIWGGEGNLDVKEKSVGLKTEYMLMTRRHIKPKRIHANRVVAYVNTPVQQIPVIAAADIPDFTIPMRELLDNDLTIGKAMYAGKSIGNTGLKVDWLREHIAVLGATGTGKTTLVKRLVSQLTEKTNVPWWVFDVKGSEYENLVFGDTENMLLLRPGLDSDFAIDLIAPQTSSKMDVSRATFAILRELIREQGASSELSPAMEKLLREAVTEVAEKEEGGNVIDLVETIKEISGKDRSARMTMDALLNRLEILTREPLSTILSGKRSSTDISELMDRRVVFDLSYVARVGGMDSARLLYNLVAKRIFEFAMIRGIQEGLHHVVVLEEASNLVPESYTRHSAADISTGESMVMLQRATGQGVIVVSTRPNISSNILANTATKIAFRLPYDSGVGAKFLSLTDEQEKYLRTLKRGRALVVLPGTEAFEIKTEAFTPKSPAQVDTGKDEHIITEPVHEPIISDQTERTISDTTQVLKSEEVGETQTVVFDRLGEITNHLIAFLASREITTIDDLHQFIVTLDPRAEEEDINELIRDLVSLGTIQRESIPLVSGGYLFTSPGRGDKAVRTVIEDYVVQRLESLPDGHETIQTSNSDIILANEKAIVVVSEHLKASSIPEKIVWLKKLMTEIGSRANELIVVVRGSIAAAKLREVMDTESEFEAVSVVSAFQSSLDKMIDSLGTIDISEKTEQTEIIQVKDIQDDIGSIHEVGSATNRAIQMRLWFGLIQDFVSLSDGHAKWEELIEFIETTSYQSLKGRSAPMSVEEGRRALTELLADEALTALRVNDNPIIDLQHGLWIVNSSKLEELRNKTLEAVETELSKSHNEISRDHGYFDFCVGNVSYVVFPTQQQLSTLLRLHSDIVCRTCSSRKMICILTAAEYMDEEVVIPSNLELKTLEEGIKAVVR